MIQWKYRKKNNCLIFFFLSLLFSAAACGGSTAEKEEGDIQETSYQESSGENVIEISDISTLEIIEDSSDLQMPDDAGVDIVEDEEQPDVFDALEIQDIAELPDVAEIAEEETVIPPPKYPPDKWGQYQVGAIEKQFFDTQQMRLLSTIIWYPAKVQGEKKKSYLILMAGNAYNEPAPDTSGAPYPVVLFSHGFNGINFQSYTMSEYIASHGYIVAAPNHQGNTLYDFSASDETVAKTAEARPKDMLFVYKEVMKLSQTQGDMFYGLADPSKTAATGHSFGGWTAIMMAGGEVDVAYGQQQCAQGTEADIFCPYINYWDPGTKLKLEEKIPGLKAAIFYTPGGVAGFTEEGMAKVYAPSMIFGGTLDDTTPLDVEIRPIFKMLPQPKIKMEIENAAHMSFTVICDIPFAKSFMGDFCDIEGLISQDKALYIAGALSAAFLGYYVKNEKGMEYYLSETYLKNAMPEVDMEKE